MNMDAIHFSEHAERCCEHLETSQLPSDQALVRMLRLQQIVEKFETARSSFTQGYRAKGVVYDFAFDFKCNSFSRSSKVDILEFINYWGGELAKYWEHILDSEKTGKGDIESKKQVAYQG